MDSTWCVVSANGRVHHQVGPLDREAIERALGGPARPVPLLSMVASHLRVWQRETPEEDDSNFPMRAILAGMVLGGSNIVGSVVVAGIEDQGIPSDILDRLDKADERARTGQPVKLLPELDVDVEDDVWPDVGTPMSKPIQDFISRKVEDVRGHVYDPPRCDLCRAFQRDRQQAGTFPLPAGQVVVVHVNGVTSWNGEFLP